MITDRCPVGGLPRAAWMRQEADEWDDIGRPDIAAHCRATAASIERQDFAGRPLLALMGEARG